MLYSVHCSSNFRNSNFYYSGPSIILCCRWRLSSNWKEVWNKMKLFNLNSNLKNNYFIFFSNGCIRMQFVTILDSLKFSNNNFEQQVFKYKPVALIRFMVSDPFLAFSRDLQDLICLSKSLVFRFRTGEISAVFHLHFVVPRLALI